MKTFLLLITLLLASVPTAYANGGAIMLFTMCDIPVYVVYVNETKVIELIPIDNTNELHIEEIDRIVNSSPNAAIAYIKLNAQLLSITGITCMTTEVKLK